MSRAAGQVFRGFFTLSRLAPFRTSCGREHALLAEMDNALFLCHVKVARGPHCEMPSHLIGAVVSCYVAAPEWQAALRLAVEELASRGYVFEDLMDGQVHQLDPSEWNEHIASTWPECPDRFPSQSDLPGFIAAGGVFFGPFLAWETEQ